MPLDKVGDATAQADSLFMTKQSLVLLRNPKIKAKPVLPVTAPTPNPPRIPRTIHEARRGTAELNSVGHSLVGPWRPLLSTPKFCNR